MRSILTTCALCTAFTALAVAQRQQPPQSGPADDPVKTIVGRLDLEHYKATVKSLTQFGDRRQGTDRNRRAVDWIEAQLKSYGCTNTQRITYDYQPPPPRERPTPEQIAAFQRARARGEGQGGSRIRGHVG